MHSRRAHLFMMKECTLEEYVSLIDIFYLVSQDSASISALCHGMA